MKVFFKRYFSLSIASGSYSKSGTNKTPIHISRSRGIGLSSAHSAIASRGDTSEFRDSVPLSGIKVSQGLDVTIEESDGASQKSFASTRNLTALPMTGEDGTSDWKQNARTVWGGFRPSNSRNGSGNQVGDKDLELGSTPGRR
jgi:hypothetical protein